jgi:hypothetical protein
MNFMKRISPVRSFTSLLVAFLLTSIVCSSLALWQLMVIRRIFCSKPSNARKSATQLPEKVESENDSKPHNNYFFIHLVGEFLQFSVPVSQHASFYHAFLMRGNTSGIPMYLSKRSILV